MRRNLLILLVCLFLLPLAGFSQEPAEPIRLAEVEQFNQSLLEMAMAEQLSGFSEDGGYLVRGNGYELLLAGEDVSADSLVLSAALTGLPDSHEQTQAALAPVSPRGVLPGMVVEDLLALYPNDNPSLAGTTDRAVLYIAGELPAAVSVGFLLRDGRSPQSIEQLVYYQAGDGVMRTGLQYTLDMGIVTAIRSFTSREALSQQQAAEELANLRSLQEQNRYVALGDRDGTRFAREDLELAGLDFLDAQLGTLDSVLGEAANQESVDNSDGSTLIISQWPGFESVFVRREGAPDHAQRLTVNGGAFEGPRGLRLGDTLAQAVSRFEHTGGADADGGALYGEADKQIPPYGLMVVNPESTLLYYAIDTQAGKAALILEFVDDLLVNMTLTYL